MVDGEGRKGLPSRGGVQDVLDPFGHAPEHDGGADRRGLAGGPLGPEHIQASLRCVDHGCQPRPPKDADETNMAVRELVGASDLPRSMPLALSSWVTALPK